MSFRFVCACFFVISMVFCSAAVFAGRTELTTYYPAPYGEYNQLSSNRVKIGSNNTANPVDGVLNFKSLASDPLPGNAGDLYYNSTAPGTFRYRDNSSWKNFGGGLTASSMSQNGYAQIGNLLIQWGYARLGSVEGGYTVNFPVTFTEVYSVVATRRTSDNIYNDAWVDVYDVTRTRFKAYVQISWEGHVGPSSPVYAYWQAIGRKD